MGKDNSGGILQGFFSKLSGSNKKVTVIVILGFVGILLILFSDMLGSGKTEAPAAVQETTVMSSAEYVEKLEERIGTLIASIDGVGEARVMITLEQGVEYVYAREGKLQYDMLEDQTDENGGKTQVKNSSEQSYLLIDDGSGKSPLITTLIEPKVQGVVVVCEGADDIHVQESLMNALTTVLGISSTRVCIVKLVN